MSSAKNRGKYRGLLVIGDPHLSGRPLDFRRDDYAKTIMGKLKFCIDYAKKNKLLPALLGDFFDRPRDNPTWMLCELIKMFDTEIIGLYGNHDCSTPELTTDDSLSILIAGGAITLLEPDAHFAARMNGRDVYIRGSSYRNTPPVAVVSSEDAPKPLVIWLTHHDITTENYQTPRSINPSEIKNVDVVINGHIHHREEPIQKGETLWLTPGNISRRRRGVHSREKVPSAMQLLVTDNSCEIEYVEIPHAPYEEVFYEAEDEDAPEVQGSEFVAGLAELQRRATESGAGLKVFLEKNIDKFDTEVQKIIMELAEEVTENG